MSTVPGFPAPTLPLAGTETLWLTQGAGASRDKEITVSDLLAQYLSPKEDVTSREAIPRTGAQSFQWYKLTGLFSLDDTDGSLYSPTTSVFPQSTLQLSALGAGFKNASIRFSAGLLETSLAGGGVSPVVLGLTDPTQPVMAELRSRLQDAGYPDIWGTVNFVHTKTGTHPILRTYACRLYATVDDVWIAFYEPGTYLTYTVLDGVFGALGGVVVAHVSLDFSALDI